MLYGLHDEFNLKIALRLTSAGKTERLASQTQRRVGSNGLVNVQIIPSFNDITYIFFKKI